MHVEKLIIMANQIGDFFEAQPGRDESEQGIANHIHKFWEPRMRKAIYIAIDKDSASDKLHPMVLKALTSHRAEIEPK